MIHSWGNPPNIHILEKELNNLKIWCGIFTKTISISGIPEPGKKYWSNLPENLSIEQFYSWTISTDYTDMFEIKIPYKIYFGELESYPAAVVDNGSYLFYLIIDYIPPSELYNIIFAIFLAIIFILSLYFFIRKYLEPVQLMKTRIKALEEGDLTSKVPILGQDELAELSYSMNKMIEDINILLENKHQLLLEVSHELRSPLARMQLLVEMLPEHKNNKKIRYEINFLEGMIDNLLLSDRLTMPYSKLDLKKLEIHYIFKKIIKLFPYNKQKIKLDNQIPNEKILVDETKFIVAIRNLIDNAIKYSNNSDVVVVIRKMKNKIEFIIKDFGIGIADKDIEKITEPFFQANKTVSTQGFGLGLTICKKIIEFHNGNIKIESKKGKGSEFSVSLPCI